MNVNSGIRLLIFFVQPFSMRLDIWLELSR